MVSCTLVWVPSSELNNLHNTLFRKQKVKYRTVRLREQSTDLFLHVENVRENRYGIYASGFFDKVLTLYNVDEGEFQVKISEPFDVQLYSKDPENPNLLGIFARRENAEDLVNSLKLKINWIIFNLDEGYEKIRSSSSFQDVKVLRFERIVDRYITTATLGGRRILHSPLVDYFSKRLRGKIYALALVFRSRWVKVYFYGHIYAPARMPSTRESFVLDLYKELKKLNIVLKESIDIFF